MCKSELKDSQKEYNNHKILKIDQKIDLNLQISERKYIELISFLFFDEIELKQQKHNGVCYIKLLQYNRLFISFLIEFSSEQAFLFFIFLLFRSLFHVLHSKYYLNVLKFFENNPPVYLFSLNFISDNIIISP